MQLNGAPHFEGPGPHPAPRERQALPEGPQVSQGEPTGAPRSQSPPPPLSTRGQGKGAGDAMEQGASGDEAAVQSDEAVDSDEEDMVEFPPGLAIQPAFPSAQMEAAEFAEALGSGSSGEDSGYPGKE